MRSPLSQYLLKRGATTVNILLNPLPSKWHPMGSLDSVHGSSLKQTASCGQSHKASMIVIYDSRVVPDLKIPHITTLDA